MTYHEEAYECNVCGDALFGDSVMRDGAGWEHRSYDEDVCPKCIKGGF